MDCIKQLLTFHQLIYTGDFFGTIDCVDDSDPLGQVDVVREGSGQVGQQSVKGSNPVRRDGIHYAVEVPVTIAVKAHFLRFLLRAQSFEGARPVQAAVGAVSGAEQPVRPSCASAMALHFVPLVKMFLHVVQSN